MIRWCRCTMLSVQYMHLSSYLISFRLYSYTYFQTLILGTYRDQFWVHVAFSGLDIKYDPTTDEGVWVICLIPVSECFPTGDGGDGSV